MNRRDFLATVLTSSSVLVAGCGSDSDSNSTSAPDVDTGVVYDGEISELRNWQVNVIQGQTVTVEATDIEEGERLRFQVGDGTAFVHTYEFYTEGSGTSNEYQFESDGQHQLQLSADRHEAPVNEEVTISATMELSEP